MLQPTNITKYSFNTGLSQKRFCLNLTELFTLLAVFQVKVMVQLTVEDILKHNTDKNRAI
jgi:hypothetical protein